MLHKGASPYRYWAEICRFQENRQEIETLELMYEGSTIPLTSNFGVATHYKNINIDNLLKDASWF